MTDLLTQCQQRGSDKQFREWVQKQPSCISGHFSEYLESGEGRCIAAHYRTAYNSGIGCKPDYSCLPFTVAEHNEQHRVGQFNYLPREKWERLIAAYRQAWINS